jgi:hypothetical protein
MDVARAAQALAPRVALSFLKSKESHSWSRYLILKGGLSEIMYDRCGLVKSISAIAYCLYKK